jgi:hypothetical protein
VIFDGCSGLLGGRDVSRAPLRQARTDGERAGSKPILGGTLERDYPERSVRAITLQFHLAQLDRGLRVGVVRDVAHDGLGVRPERLLECLDRVE